MPQSFVALSCVILVSVWLMVMCYGSLGLDVLSCVFTAAGLIEQDAEASSMSDMNNLICRCPWVGVRLLNSAAFKTYESTIALIYVRSLTCLIAVFAEMVL